MTTVVDDNGSRGVQVVGVDTHKDQHVAVAVDQLGVGLGQHRVLTTMEGYGELERWAGDFGEIRAFGVEGTGSYGAGLARFLSPRHTVCGGRPAGPFHLTQEGQK